MRGLSRAYAGRPAVDAVALDVEGGEILALLGPSGCGKTTTLRMLAGLEVPDAGTITVGGELLSGPDTFLQPERRRIGMVFQDYALFPHLDVGANVGYALGRRPDPARVERALGLVGLGGYGARAVHELSGGEQQRVALARALAPDPGLVLLDEPFSNLDVGANVGYALGRRPDPARVERALGLVGLGGYGARAVHELSGGEQQRVALARALAPDPGLVLLDEPFSNLDATLRVHLRAEVRAILSSAGVTALFVTHDQEEALSIADRVAVMRAGRIEQVGTPEEVYLRPASRWVAGFLGDIDVLPAESSGNGTRCELGAVPGTVAGEAEVLIRPESIAIGLSGPADGVEAEITRRTFYGHDQMLHLRLPSGTIVRSRRISFPAWHTGDRVRAWIEGPANVVARGGD